MKKIIAMLLALTVVLGLAACGNDTAKDTTPATTTPVETTEAPVETTEEFIEETIPAPATNGASDLINAIWNAIPEDNKFFAMGGDWNNIADNAAGVYGLEDQEAITATLLIPADQIANVEEAASLMHAMMANNFTCGAFKVTDAAAFAETMHGMISTNPWMCGMPEKMVIATIGGEHVVAMFGVNDAVNPFEEKLVAAYPDAVIVYSEAITG